ncbi:MAG: hypothetical protein A2289_24405 [Deltaproteobacteria bacterium RIFOXYA12_FULL_58_15]|nr:MAG: hypothetical protein A2289_24405 [Deltaproteobacteria bacterium RIFOXYA12_FULL_58_15]OGR08993.1 MAG: hypothetical protein A2341_11655 [Deltaproteobacteria bacterium RIFOXYB12_FULL_58_9]
MAMIGLLIVVSVVGAILQRKWGISSSVLTFQRDGILNLQLWRTVTYAVVETDLLEMVQSLVFLWAFGGWFETTFGHERFVRFFLAATLGGAVLALPLSYLVDLLLPFADTGSQGPAPALNALVVAYAIANPKSNVLAGLVLPVRARTVIFFLLGFEILRGFLDGLAALSITLGGMTMGYLVFTGHWNPVFWRDRLREQRLNKRRKSLRVVPPNREKM